MSTAYQTKQKDRILAQLSAHPDRSFTAKDIYELCHRSGTPVGMATVYRQLDGLSAENRVGKILDGKGLRYQYLDDNGHDFHIKCDNCGKLSPVCCGILDGVSAHMSEQHGFRIDAAKSVLYGRCRDCP